MKPSRIFIASSSEGLPVTEALQAQLQQRLGGDTELRPWTREFDLSATYIESLERAAERADFAVLVVTPDDLTTSRARRSPAPRDNVVFEAGLFMGSLGRERCFIVSEEQPRVKLPSDLLGVHVAGFKRPAAPAVAPSAPAPAPAAAAAPPASSTSPAAGPDPTLLAALASPADLLAQHIGRIGPRLRLSAEQRSEQLQLWRLGEALEGAWWEHVTSPAGSSMLSHCRIALDPICAAVTLTGRSYDRAGRHVAHWKSLLARLDTDDCRVLYHWQGWMTQDGQANVPYHGFGEMNFDPPPAPDAVIQRGSGKFWNVDEANPARTVVRSIELRRILDTQQVATLTTGSVRKQAELVKATLRDW